MAAGKLNWLRPYQEEGVSLTALTGFFMIL